MNISELNDNTGRVNFGHIYEENKNVEGIRRSSFTNEAMSDMVELTLLGVIPLRFVFKKTHHTEEKMVVGNGIFTVLARFIEGEFALNGKYISGLAGKTYDQLDRPNQRKLMGTGATYTVLAGMDADAEKIVNEGIHFTIRSI